jgi:hypothetical protein
MSSICAARLRASCKTWVEETIARGRGLSGDRGGSGGERFSCPDEKDSYMGVEGK